MNEPEKENLPRDIAVNCLAARIRLLDRAISSIYNKAISPHGLRITQMNIIVAVAAFGPTEVKPLGLILNMDSSTISRALARIEKKGYLKTEPSGQGKNLLISVTDEGMALLQRVFPDWKRAEKEAEELLGRETAGAIRRAGDKMLRAGVRAQSS